MSSIKRNDAIQTAKQYKTLIQDLDSIAQLGNCIHVTRLQDCLVNIVVSSLRYFAAFMAKIDPQEYKYLDTVKMNIQSILEGQEKMLFSLINTLTVDSYVIARHRYVRCLFRKYNSANITNHIAQDARD